MTRLTHALRRTALAAALLAAWPVPPAMAAAVLSGPGSELISPAETRLPAGSVRPAGHPGRDLYNQGQIDLAAGRLDAARRAFEALARLQPAPYVASLGLAEVALRSGQPAEAERHLRSALDSAPRSAEVQAAAGRLAFGVGKTEEASRHLRRAIELDARFLTPRLDLAEMQLAAGQAALAAQTFREAVAADGQHAGAHFGLGRALAAQADLQAAADAFARAAQAAPKIPLPLLALADVQARLGRLAAARDSSERAWRMDPQSLRACLLHAQMLTLAGQREPAERVLQQGLAHHQGSNAAALHLQLGTLQQQSGRLKEAQESYLAATRADAGFHPAYNNLAWLAAEQKRELPQALSWIQQALRLAPSNAGYHDTLGFVHEASGRPADAVAAYTVATQADGTQPLFAYHLGRALQTAGQPERALAAFDKALALAKGHEPFIDDARTRRDGLRPPTRR